VVHASGLPSLTVDMVDYLEHDIFVFGIAVALFLLLTLFAIFRKPRFVLIPLATCLIVVVTIMGLTVAMGVETTIVTSNMSSLLFIIGMAHSIHLVIKYREERALHPARPYKDTIHAAVEGIWLPCLYTALTTCVGFASLRITDIEPVKDFAFFMSIGVMLAFAVSLVFVPACLAVLPPTEERVEDATAAKRNPVLGALAALAVRRRGVIYAVSLLLAAGAAYGMSQVRVDQRFVEYFDESTEVHQGLEFVDEVGGTMTVEVILWGDTDGYWLEEDAYKRVAAVHQWFEQQGEQVGKVLSIVSFREHARALLQAKMPLFANAPLKLLMTMLPSGLR
jgi:predicted RND superfamily exporter protein